MKKVLILGGTGAIGKALVEMLDKFEYEIYVTSRKKHENSEVTYLQGNAHDVEFLDSILNMQQWNSIVDFMIYKTNEFKHLIGKMFEDIKQKFTFKKRRLKL